MINKNLRPPLAAIERKFSMQKISEDILKESDPEDEEKQADTSQKNVPNNIKALIKRRCDALKHKFSPHPQTGQIVLLKAETLSSEKSSSENSSSDFHLNQPLFVLLDAINEKGQWEGWSVSQETDYASRWDICLDPKQDGPLDPLVGMVQVWNSVSLDAEMIMRTVGELNIKRLDSIYTLEEAYQNSQRQPLAEFAENDPRHRYQELYKQAAHCISKIAEERQRRSKPKKVSLNQWLQRLFVQLDATQWTIVPRVNYAMGDDENNDLLLEGALRIQVIETQPYGDNDLLIKLAVSLEKEGNYSVEFFEDENLEHYFKLSKDKPKADFLYRSNNDDSELIIRDENDNIVHRFFLNES